MHYGKCHAFSPAQTSLFDLISPNYCFYSYRQSPVPALLLPLRFLLIGDSRHSSLIKASVVWKWSFDGTKKDTRNSFHSREIEATN